MGFFNSKRLSESDLRFCQHASELPVGSLFTNWDLDIAISRIEGISYKNGVPSDSAIAVGIVDNPMRNGPDLPATVEFLFDTRSDHIGRGEVFKRTNTSTTEFYRSHFTIYDPDGVIYHQFLSVVEHAAISGLPSAMLTLRKPPSSPFPKGVSVDEWSNAERAKLKQLMLKVEDGREKMPPVVFSEVLFDDEVVLRAPEWTYRWGAECMGTPIFHDPGLAQWRTWKKNQS